MRAVVVECAVVSSSMMPFQLLGCRGLQLCEGKERFLARKVPAKAESAILAKHTGVQKHCTFTCCHACHVQKCLDRTRECGDKVRRSEDIGVHAAQLLMGI